MVGLPMLFVRVIRASLIATGVLLCQAQVSEAQQIIPISIISIGDSYASGEGAPDTDASQSLWLGDNSDGLAMSCHRSARAAPVEASRLVAAVRPVVFHSFACSGATMAQLSISGDQLTRLTSILRSQGIASIDALIISAGGNDIGFAEIVGACMIFPCVPGIVTAVPQNLTKLASSFKSLSASIRGLGMPVRHVFVTEYPDVSTTPFYPPPPGLPPHGRCGGPTTMNIPGSGFDLLDFSRADIAARTVVEPLNSALSAFVTLENDGRLPTEPIWHFVSGIASSFYGHGYCMGWPFPAVMLQPHMGIKDRWINTLIDSANLQRDHKGTMHPNVTGHAAAGAVIANAIKTFVPIVTTGPIDPPGPPREDPPEPDCPRNVPDCSRN